MNSKPAAVNAPAILLYLSMKSPIWFIETLLLRLNLTLSLWDGGFTDLAAGVIVDDWMVSGEQGRGIQNRLLESLQASELFDCGG